jgi:flagellar hook-associated protein 2
MSTTTSIASLISQQTNPYEKFVKQLVELESRQKLLLQSQKSTMNERKTALGEVSSSISRFLTQVKDLQTPANRSFSPFATKSTNDSVVRVNSASGMQNPASFDITVNRLAKQDIALSQATDKDGTALSATGTGSVTLTVGDKTETITLDTSGKTDSEVMTALAGQINELFGDKVSSNMFMVDAQNSQFSIKSKGLGFDNRIQLSDWTGDLAGLNMSNIVPQNELNAQFTMDGVSFERSTNTITDAVEGLSFTLLKDTGAREEISVTRDIDKAKANVDAFVGSFNNLNRVIRDRTFLDAENNRRGSLQDVRTVRNLTLNMRQIGLLPSESAQPGEIARFSDIGIEFEKDGRMVVKNSSKLTAALEQNSEQVMALFTDENGPASKMRDLAEGYTKANDGVLASIDKGFDFKISNLNTRIKAQEKYLENYEKQQRDQFNKLNLIIEQGISQYDQVMAFRNQMFGFY